MKVFGEKDCAARVGAPFARTKGHAPSSEIRQRRKNDVETIIVVLPAYNEAAGIAPLLSGIRAALSHANVRYEIVVVNDGSTDGTWEILGSLRDSIPELRLINHAINQGLGATLRDGLYAAAEHAHEDDIVVTMDADETHAPALILRLIGRIREGYDVVIASRYQPGSRVVGVSRGRELMSAGASALMRLLFPIRGVRDYTCGYRAYRAGVLKRAIQEYGSAFVDQEGFQCMVDIILKLRTGGAVFGEVPMVLRYDRKKGASKMPVLSTVGSTLKLLARRRLGLR